MFRALTSVALTHPHFLHAKTYSLDKLFWLAVYRSPACRESDPIYAPVRAYLDKHGLELHRRGMFVDVDMMLGQGELSLYLHPASERPDEDDPVEFVPTQAVSA